MTLKLFLLLTFLSVLPFGYSQITIDDIDKLISEETTNSLVTRESMFKNAFLVDSLSKKIGYLHGIVEAKINLGFLYQANSPDVLGENVMVLDSIYQLDTSAFTGQNTIDFFLLMGYYTGRSLSTEKEIAYYLKADSLATLKNDINAQASVYFYLSRYAHNVMKDWKLAAKYAKKEADLLKQAGEMNRYFSALKYVASIYIGIAKQLNDTVYYDTVIYYINEAYRQVPDIKETREQRGGYFKILANAYLGKENITQAQIMLDSFCTYLNDPYLAYSYPMVDYYFMQGDVKMLLKETDSAIIYFEKSSSIADSLGWEHGQLQASLRIVETNLRAMKRFDLLEHINCFIDLRDSAYNRASKKMQQQFLVQFDTNKKEIEVQKLQTENERKQKIIIIILLISIILAFTTFLIIYYNRIRRRLLAQKLETEQLKKEHIKSKLKQALGTIEDNANRIHQLKKEIVEKTDRPENIDQMISILNQNYLDESSWTKVLYYFDLLNDNFTEKLKQKFNNLTKNDLQLLILFQLQYSNKEIASVKNITESGVKKAKTRLLSKLQLNRLAELSV